MCLDCTLLENNWESLSKKMNFLTWGSKDVVRVSFWSGLTCQLPNPPSPSQLSPTKNKKSAKVVLYSWRGLPGKSIGGLRSQSVDVSLCGWTGIVTSFSRLSADI